VARSSGRLWQKVRALRVRYAAICFRMPAVARRQRDIMRAAAENGGSHATIITWKKSVPLARTVVDQR